MPEIVIPDDESFERALKRFKKKCEKAGMMNAARRKGRPPRPRPV